MGYRFDNTPPDPDDLLERFTVVNGATMHISLGCFYIKPHNYKLHDHVGWPNPDKPDSSCQALGSGKFFNMKDSAIVLKPIDLAEEGYVQVETIFDDNDYMDYIDVYTSFDDVITNKVKVVIDTNLPEFSEPIKLKFTVFASKDQDDPRWVDAVCRGIAVILPSTPSV